MSDPRQLRVAAVQMACDLNAFVANTRRASQWIGEAASQGAELVLLPELMPRGYTLSERLWDGAEPFEGETLSWLRAEASRHGLMLGTTFLEAVG